MLPHTFGSGPRRAAEGPSNPWRKAAWSVLVAGAVGAVGWVVFAWIGQTNHLNSFVDVPTNVGETVEVSDGGIHTVWATREDGSSPGFRPRASLRFEGPVDGEQAVSIELIPADSTTTYSIDGRRQGVAVGTVDFPESGTYTLVERDLRVPGVDLALGSGEGMPYPIVRPALIIAMVTVATLVVVLLLAWRLDRRRADRLTEEVTSPVG